MTNPPRPNVPTGAISEVTNLIKELQNRIERLEGKREEEMIYFSAYTGYLKAYIEKFANIANRKDLMKTGILDSQKFAREAVAAFREGLSQEE